MIHDNPYDQAAQDNADEDRRQSRAEEAEEATNERRQLGANYWAALDDEERLISPADDLTNNETPHE